MNLLSIEKFILCLVAKKKNILRISIKTVICLKPPILNVRRNWLKKIICNAMKILMKLYSTMSIFLILTDSRVLGRMFLANITFVH